MIGDTPIGTGDWSAELFGNGRSDDEPGSVAGMFDAHGAQVDISGAFGAHNVSPEE